MSLSATVKSPSELTAEEVRAWRGFMARQQAFCSPFYSPHYVQAVNRVRPGVRVCVIRSGDETVAFFPFQFSSTAARLLGAAHPVGDHMTDYVGVVPAPGFRISSRRLLALCGLNRFQFFNLEQSQADLGLHGGTTKKGWIIDFSDGPETYWETTKSAKPSKHRIRGLDERRQRLVKTYGPLSFTFDATNRPEELERLVALKKEQYRRRGVPDALEQRWTVDLLRTLALSSTKECTGVLSVLCAGDRWVASYYGLRDGNLLHDWFPVYDHELREFGPGLLLYTFLINEGWKHGLTKIDAGCGDYQHKRKLGTYQNAYYAGVWYRNAGSSVVLGSVASLRRQLRRGMAFPNRVGPWQYASRSHWRMPDGA